MIMNNNKNNSNWEILTRMEKVNDLHIHTLYL